MNPGKFKNLYKTAICLYWPLVLFFLVLPVACKRWPLEGVESDERADAAHPNTAGEMLQLQQRTNREKEGVAGYLINTHDITANWTVASGYVGVTVTVPSSSLRVMIEPASLWVYFFQVPVSQLEEYFRQPGISSMSGQLVGRYYVADEASDIRQQFNLLPGMALVVATLMADDKHFFLTRAGEFYTTAYVEPGEAHSKPLAPPCVIVVSPSMHESLLLNRFVEAYPMASMSKEAMHDRKFIRSNIDHVKFERYESSAPSLFVAEGDPTPEKLRRGLAHIAGVAAKRFVLEPTDRLANIPIQTAVNGTFGWALGATRYQKSGDIFEIPYIYLSYSHPVQGAAQEFYMAAWPVKYSRDCR